MFSWKKRRIDDEERQDERTPLLSALAQAPETDLVAETDDLLLRLATAFGALQKGKMPSTEQLCRCLRALLDSDVLALPESHTITPSRLSQAGTQVVLDFRKLLHALMVALLQFNNHDALQSFIFHTKKAQTKVVPDVDVPNVEVPTIKPQQVERDIQAFLHGLRTLARVLASNILSTSNSLLEDLFSLIRLVLADAADEIADRSHHAATALRPEERDNSSKRPMGQDDLEKEAEALKDTLKDTASAFQQAGRETAGRQATFQELAQQDYKNVILQRVHRLLDNIKGQPAASQAVLTCTDLLDRYLTQAEEALDAAQQVASETEVGAKIDDPGGHGESALKALREVIEKLAGESLEPLFQSAARFRTDVRDNDELANLLHDTRRVLKRALQDDQNRPVEQLAGEVEELYDRGAQLLAREPSWRGDLHKVAHDLTRIWEEIRDNEELTALRGILGHLLKAFAVFSKRAVWTLEGEVGDIWRDVANVLLPRLLTYVRHLSVPRTEVSTPWLDVVVDDLRLADLVLLPTKAHLTQRTDLAFERAPGEAGAFHVASALGTLQMAGFSYSCAGVSLALSRKFATWLPYLRRFSSLAEIHLPLPGVSTSLSYTRLAPSWSNGTSFTRLDDLTVTLPTLRVRFRKSSHPVITFVLSRLSTPLTRFILARVLQQQLKAGYEAVDAKLFAIGREAADRGGSIEAWLSAVMEAFNTDSDDEEVHQDAEAEEDRPMLAGVHATRVGLVKDDPETDVAFAIGVGPQIVDGEVTGPKYDSLADVIQDAQRATPSIPAPGMIKKQLQQGFRDVQEGKNQGDKLAQAAETWRSGAFDIVH